MCCGAHATRRSTPYLCFRVDEQVAGARVAVRVAVFDVVCARDLDGVEVTDLVAERVWVADAGPERVAVAGRVAIADTVGRDDCDCC